MKDEITVQIAEGLGNQLFMYAHAYALAQKLDRKLMIDNTSGYFKKKNSLRNHQVYMLNFFEIVNEFTPHKFRFDTLNKNFLKKILILIDKLKINKKFLYETSIKIGSKKKVNNYNFDNLKFDSNLYIFGNYENEAYFKDYKNDFINLFTPKQEFLRAQNKLVSKLRNSNSVSIHIRRNRFSDQKKLDKVNDKDKSEKFTNHIIEYTNRSIKYIIKNVQDPQFFIWSNDFTNFDEITNKLDLKNYVLIDCNDPINDFYLFKFAKHFIVGPSSFHWWGGWLNDNKNKICLRPSNLNPSNNEKFWPDEWISI